MLILFDVGIFGAVGGVGLAGSEGSGDHPLAGSVWNTAPGTIVVRERCAPLAVAAFLAALEEIDLGAVGSEEFEKDALLGGETAREAPLGGALAAYDGEEALGRNHLAVDAGPGELFILVDGDTDELDGEIAGVVEFEELFLVCAGAVYLVEFELGPVGSRVAHLVAELVRRGGEVGLVHYGDGEFHVSAVGLCGDDGGVGAARACHGGFGAVVLEGGCLYGLQAGDGSRYGHCVV